ncbi:MAG: hypothetical protein ACRDG4_20890 [Chloroflexota bacterium]
MSPGDPVEETSFDLTALQSAFATAQTAPPPAATLTEAEEQGDIATPRAKAALALEASLRTHLEWCEDRDDRIGEQLCRLLIDMCTWHEHPRLRDSILSLQGRGIALLNPPEGRLGMGDVGEIEDEYQTIKPREDDAAAIAAALGMSLDEARSFGLVGTLSGVGVNDETPAPAAFGRSESEPEAEEDLETLFRREALVRATKTLPQALQHLWGAQQSMDALITVRRGFHTLKGDARVTAQATDPDTAEELEGLAVLSEAAEDIIDYLLGDDYDPTQPAPTLPPGAFSLLNEAATAIVTRLESRAPLKNEASLLRRLEAMQRKAAAQSGAPIDEASIAAKIPMPAAGRPKPTTRSLTTSAKGPVDSLWTTFL